MNSLPGGKLRWGICSAGKISNDFCAALKLLPAEEQQIAAVAARSKDSAHKFAKTFSIPRVHGSYEELSKDQELDIIYIGAIHTEHARLSKMFLEAGHNVLCEKPMAMNERELKEVLEVAKKQNRFFMEGFWSRFFPIYSTLRDALASQTIGEVQMLHIAFGNAVLSSGDFNPRMVEKEMGGGALLDMGCYTVMFANLVFKGMPKEIVAQGVLVPSGVDGTTTITLMYDNNRIARLTTSMTCALDNTAVISGTKGKIVIPQFWTPVEMDLNGKKIENAVPKSSFPLFFHNSEGFLFEARCVRECLLKGHKECTLMPHEDSLTITRIMDEARRQIGVKYPQDQ